MDERIGVGLIVGFTIASTFFVYETKRFNKSQKVFLYLCIIFPPAQWLGILILLLINNLAYKNSVKGKKEKRLKEERTDYQTKLEDLRYLKDQKILTEKEYKEKAEAIDSLNTESKFKQSNNYKKLKKLYDNGILTQQEFEAKVQIIKNKASFSNQQKQQFDKEKIDDDFLKGLWKMKDGNLLLNGSKSFEIQWRSGSVSKGKWNYHQNTFTLILNFLNNEHITEFKIKDAGDNYIKYLNGRSYFTIERV